MMNSNAENSPLIPTDEANQTQPIKMRRLPLILIGIAIILVGVAAGSLSGYQSGMSMRENAATAQILQVTTDQYKMLLIDQQAGRLETARRRMEYILQLDPNFPGGKDKLAELMIGQQLTSTPATPTPQPSPTLTPTPDTRNEEQLFEQARQYLAQKEWDSAIQVMDHLRDVNVDYRPVDVDGMYYVALRYRGERKILVEGNLEGGIYDLTLSEKIGPLDANSINYRKWARMYLTAASYWDADWPKVIALFKDIYPALPGLRDGSGMTATERYRNALIGYGDSLSRQEKWCEASEQYNLALEFAPDPAVQQKLQQSDQGCHPPETETPIPQATLMPTLGTLVPTETTPQPTDTTPTVPVEPPPTE